MKQIIATLFVILPKSTLSIYARSVNRALLSVQVASNDEHVFEMLQRLVSYMDIDAGERAYMCLVNPPHTHTFPERECLCNSLDPHARSGVRRLSL